MKRWKLLEPVPEEAYSALPAQPRLLAALLWRRGVRTAEEAGRFLNPSWERDIHDPFEFVDMGKAVERLLRAVGGRERVVVHGDYDADGVSGAVVLHSTLKALGADVSVYLPHREKDGYGMNAPAVRRMAEDGAKVVVTCDCGISNGPEIALAAGLGIDVIVTDHHTLPPEPPPAYAILHPQREGETYPFKHLTGGGVAFKLCQALWREAGLPEGQEKWLLDMVSISTVADMGRLVGENRALVHYGLKVLNKTRRLGLGKLVAAARRGEEKLDAASIGFRIAPRINAAGRMDHADAAFALLTAEKEEEASLHAMRLDDRNRERQAAVERLAAEARLQAASQREARVLFVSGVGWPAALCGLIAARLVDDHGRPALALGRTEDGRWVGSGRSIPGFDITAALRECSGHLTRFGGHPAACGLTVPDDASLEAFKAEFGALAAARLAEADLTPILEIEEELPLRDATLEAAELVARLEPHGEGNSKPRFLIRRVTVAAAQAVGKDAKHLRLTVTGHEGGRLKLIGFGFGPELAKLSPGVAVDAVIELGLNEWNGRVETQGRIVDMRICSST